MKTYPNPHNPENLPPPEPGYRYLGKDEPRMSSDGVLTTPIGSPFGTPRQWLSFNSSLLAWGDKIPSPQDSPDWTVRRALNVDDPKAPPPDQWTIAGWTVFPEAFVNYYPNPGEEYWADGSRVWYPAAHPSGKHLEGRWYIRRPVDAKTLWSDTAKMPYSDKTFRVSCGDSQSLAKAVQTIAIEAGYSWYPADNRSLNLKGPYVYVLPSFSNGLFIVFNPNGKQMTTGGYPSGCKSLDARTDLGVLIDLLEAAKAPVSPVINGYEGKYAKGDDVVEFGCAKIAVNLLECVRAVADKAQPGNRTLQSVTLSSGVAITREQVKNVLDYIDAVNKAS